MPFPDNLGACPSLFPTFADLLSEVRQAAEDRQAAAVRRIDAAMEEMAHRVQALASPDGAGPEDVAEAEVLAEGLEGFIEAMWPAAVAS